MRLLLTNDDGIQSNGIRILADYLSKAHEVWIVAPDSNRSAASHCLTMDRPLSICKAGGSRYTCSGTPVDCVVASLRGILPFVPDAVVSGINKGANIGTDVLYSGTAAAARQAVLYGVPGIALSIETKDGNWHYDAMASFVEKNLNSLIGLCSSNVFVNVNALSLPSYTGFRFTKLAKRDYRDTVQLFKCANGSEFSVFTGGKVDTESHEDADFTAVENGYVSISRIYAEPVAAECSSFNDVDFCL